MVGNAAIRRLLPKNYTVVQSIHSTNKESSSEFEDDDSDYQQPLVKTKSIIQDFHTIEKRAIIAPKIFSEQSPQSKNRQFKMASKDEPDY